MTIVDAIERFSDYVVTEKRLSEGTTSYYVGGVKAFAQYLYDQGVEELSEIDASQVRQWQMNLMEKGEAPGTVRKLLAALRAWFKYLRGQQLIDSDIMAKIISPRMSKRLPVFFRENEVEHIYDDIYPEGYEGELEKLVLRLLYETGMRRAELAGLTVGNIDLAGLTIKVRGKRDKERIIPIENELARNISHYLSLRNTKKGELSAEKPEVLADDHLLMTEKGKAVDTNVIYAIVRKYMSVLSTAERTSPHVFRHTFATQMLNEGANIDAIKELLGHADLSATEVYTHVTREHLRETYKHAHPRATKK